MSLMTAAAVTPAEGTAPVTPAAADATPPAGEGTPPSAPIVTGDWYYDDNLKGSGARPDWLKDKYKSAAEQAKAYVEVEKKLGAFKGAPDAYDLSLQDFPDIKFSQEDPLLKDFLTNAKTNGVSQEYITEILNTYAQALTFNIPDADAEMKKIGANAAQDLQILSQWAGNYLSAEEHKVFASLVTTADAFKVFDKLRQSVTQSDIAAPQKSGTPAETEDQVRALISDPRYSTDEHFRADVRRRMSIALASGKK